MTELTRLTTREALRCIARCELTSEELVRACAERIAARGGAVKAWAHFSSELALEQARRLDRSGEPGVLRGLPIGVKDIVDTDDQPTGYGSPIYAGHRPAADAASVALARTAGAVIMGKTVTTEFAYRHTGPTANPHNPGHTPAAPHRVRLRRWPIFRFRLPSARRLGVDDLSGGVLRHRRLQADLRGNPRGRGETHRSVFRHDYDVRAYGRRCRALSIGAAGWRGG